MTAMLETGDDEYALVTGWKRIWPPPELIADVSAARRRNCARARGTRPRSGRCRRMSRPIRYGPFIGPNGPARASRATSCLLRGSASCPSSCFRVPAEASGAGRAQRAGGGWWSEVRVPPGLPGPQAGSGDSAAVMRRRFSTCFSTVRGDRCSRAAISLFEMPAATSRSTSACRSVMPSRDQRLGCGLARSSRQRAASGSTWYRPNTAVAASSHDRGSPQPWTSAGCGRDQPGQVSPDRVMLQVEVGRHS